MNLTPRQSEIAGMVAKGLSTRAIASETGLSPDTVNAHIKQAAHRLGGDTAPRHRLTIWFFHVLAEEPERVA
jgi:DNA-binding NarL/FixJ family response regulator